MSRRLGFMRVHRRATYLRDGQSLLKLAETAGNIAGLST
jgi:hypothetical protein